MHKSFVCAVILVALVASADVGRAESITTMFASTSGQSGNMFDVQTGGDELTVTALDLNLFPGTYVVEVYTKSGTWEGANNNPAAWTLVGAGAVVSQGIDNPSPFDVTDFALAANATTGLYVTTTTPGGFMRYTAGTGEGNVVAANSDLTILEGVGVQYPFSSTFRSRIWNGTIHYDVATDPSTTPVVPLPAAAWGGLALFGAIGANRLRRRGGEHV